MQLNMMISNWGQNISVNNMAIKSCNTQCWVGQHGYWESIQEDPPDLIIFEMAVNDQTYGSEQNVESLYRVYEALLYKLKNSARSPALLAWKLSAQQAIVQRTLGLIVRPMAMVHPSRVHLANTSGVPIGGK
jgi:hypothetical protein